MGESENCIFPMEDALEMILMFGGTGEIFYANAAARGKLGYADLKNQHISTLFPNTFKRTENGFESAFPFGDEAGHLIIYRRNLTCFPVEARIKENARCPGTYICMANDILEQEHLGREISQAREEAQQAARLKAEFVANVTHELRTPVNGILGNVRELLEDAADARTVKTLRLVERCCGDMNKIINNILDFSKLDAGKFVLEPRRFHFRNMLDYVKAQHISKITEKGLDFFMTVSPQVPEYIIGDELRIVQILNNLLSNALKFTAVGEIALQVLRTAQVEEKAELFFIVSDTGIGIGEEDMDKLFQSFSQVDASISRKYGGTGLGLSICRQLVELMGGRIEAESRKGKGSNFSFSIWVEAEQEASLKEPDDGKAVFLQMAANGRSAAHEESAGQEADGVREYGTSENREALKRHLSRLVLSVEMENWEKAEMFMETIRQLTEGAPSDVRRQILRLKMAVQKENYDKVMDEYRKLRMCDAAEQ